LRYSTVIHYIITTPVYSVDDRQATLLCISFDSLSCHSSVQALPLCLLGGADLVSYRTCMQSCQTFIE